MLSLDDDDRLLVNGCMPAHQDIQSNRFFVVLSFSCDLIGKGCRERPKLCLPLAISRTLRNAPLQRDPSEGRRHPGT